MASKKILVAEDDIFIQDIYRSKLKDEGYEVICVENGRDVFKSLEAFAPDLIILDIMMPYVDGLEVLSKLREDERWKKTPVLMMTNISEKERVEQAQQQGIADYVIKSHFTPSEVLTKIKTLLGD